METSEVFDNESVVPTSGLAKLAAVRLQINFRCLKAVKHKQILHSYSHGMLEVFYTNIKKYMCVIIFIPSQRKLVRLLIRKHNSLQYLSNSNCNIKLALQFLNIFTRQENETYF